MATIASITQTCRLKTAQLIEPRGSPGARNLGACRIARARRLYHADSQIVGRGTEPIRVRPGRDERAGGRVVGKLRRPGAIRSHPPRSAREPRRARSRRSACARRGPARRSAVRALLPSIGVSAQGAITGRVQRRRQAGRPDVESQAGGGLDVSWEVDLTGRLRAGAAAAAADTMAAENGERGVRLLVMTDVATNYFTLVGALRQLETVRAISAAQDETLRLVTARQRVGLATAFDVERAQTEASQAHGGDTAARDARRRLAPPHRGADRRSGLQCRAIVPWNGVVDCSAGAARTAGRAARAQAGSARRAGAARCRQLRAASRPQRNGSRGSFSAQCSAARRGAERHRPRRGALQQRRGAAGDADLQRGPHAGDQRDRRKRPVRSVLRYENSIVRALEDVENSLVALQR